MEKEFNITGICVPEMHYMVDISNKLKEVIQLVNKGKYFIINRPRQYGKTTTLYMLERYLNKHAEYLVISISFEGIGDLIFQDEKPFSKGFLNLVERELVLRDDKLAKFIENGKINVNNLDDLSFIITKLIMKTNKKVILMIDEVDKSSNNQLFLSFLGILRNKFLLRNMGKDKTFHSIILAGVHDVKTLKVKIRSNEEQKYNSPWNIAADFDIDMSFSEEEIGTMLDDYYYTQNKKIKFDKAYFSERLFYYTSGYPFLVSKLCKIIDEKLMVENELVWKKEYMDIAVNKILKDSNTNFDTLIKNIENNEELYYFIQRIILKGEKIRYVNSDELINMATTYGILKDDEGNCKVHNRIYEQLLYDHMMIKVLRKSIYGTMSDYNYRDKFINLDGSLNIKKILVKFQEFMRHESSKNREAFLEHDARLVFLAFISPIINGVGFAFKEVTGGEERRFDIVITYEKKMYILELKIWRGEEYHNKGLMQLGEYLEQYGLEEGYLLVFDFRKESNKSQDIEEREIIIHGKKKKIVEAFC